MGDRPGLVEAKRALRAAVRRRLAAAPPDAAAAEACARAIVREPRVRRAFRVALYAALPDEMPTRPLFEALRTAGKTVLLPRVDGEGLAFAAVGRWDELREGRFGVLEPRGAAVAPPGPGDVAVVPGVAFDRQGWRLGRGRGYYDRAFPPGGPAPLLLGLGAALQWVDAVPHGSHDRQLDAIVSEQGVHWVRPGPSDGGER